MKSLPRGGAARKGWAKRREGDRLLGANAGRAVRPDDQAGAHADGEGVLAGGLDDDAFAAVVELDRDLEGVVLRGGALLDRGARERACDAAERAADGVATAAAHGGADGGAGDRAADAAERAVGAFDRHLFDAGDRTVVDRLLGAGAVAGGGLRNKTYAEPFMKSAVSDGMTNMINTSAYAAYSIRSSDKASEMRLRGQIVGIIEKYKALYAGRAAVSAVFSEKVPPFERAEDKTLETVARRAFENVGLPFKVTSFHAAAETHLYAHMTNKNGVAFKPVLIGAATIRDMHSANESVVASSIDGGLTLVESLIREYNR